MALISGLKPILQYSIPAILAQTLRMLGNIVATFFVGHLGVEALAASGLVITYFITTMLFAVGCLFSISAVAGRAFGARDNTALLRTLVDGLWLSFFVSVPTAGLIYAGPEVLDFFHQPADLVASSRLYFHLLAVTVFFSLWNSVFQQFFLAIGRPTINYFLSGMNLLLYVLFFNLFIDGALGAPMLGISGVGLGFLLGNSLTLVFAVTVFFLYRTSHGFTQAIHWHRFDVANIKKLFHAGWPIGMNMLAELGAIWVMVMLIGLQGHVALAAYQIAWQWMLIGIMISVGLAQAMSVLVGQSLGARDHTRLAVLIKSSLRFSMLISVCLSLIFLFFAPQLAQVFMHSDEVMSGPVILLACHLLYCTAFFQLFDNVRIVSQGALRGFHDVHVPLFYGLVAYWCVCLPVGMLLGWGFSLNTLGFWCGLGLADILCGCALFMRLHRHLRIYTL